MRGPLRFEGLLEFVHARAQVFPQHGGAFAQSIDPVFQPGDALVNGFDVLLDLFDVTP